MDRNDEVDRILQDIEGEKISRNIHTDSFSDAASNDSSVEEAEKRRQDKVSSFQINLDFSDEEFAAPAKSGEDADVSLRPAAPVPTEAPAPAKVDRPKRSNVKEEKSQNSGCLKKLLYGILIVLIATAIAYCAVIFLIDAMAFNQPNTQIDIEIPYGATTPQIASILTEQGIIRQPFCFRVYSKLTGADGKYQRGVFTLTPDMDYTEIIERLQETTPRETVTVTIPEGFTVEKIAKLLEENNVCAAADFYDAVISVEYDYDFVKAIPTSADGDEHAGRIYLLEGYLFPDTYNFYVASSPKTVVERMLENFNTRVDATLRAEIAARGWTIDEAIIMASVVQGEAAKADDMTKVSRVLANRMEPNSGFPKLQCDSTRDYIQKLMPTVSGVEIVGSAYNTYVRDGLPVGAINNPGLQAIKAALHPSDDPEIMKCYYFATDYRTGITYFSKTYSQHVSICRRYSIGAYA